MYQDEVILAKEGKPGVQRIVALVQTENGTEVSRFEQQNITISEPVDAVYKQGTKEIPKRSGSGTWLFPIRARYIISDYFGYRVAPTAGASTNHKGIDISCAYGTPIYAADGGTVTYAGTRGSYGKLIIINHGGGYETYYAHESEIDVKVGEEVYQGKVIGKVGSSGVSTGPHLHFEIHYQGTPLNPLSFYDR
jgi:murein DD-endopeptidase MepM/ murein hydrolase activator NlpD